MVQFSSVLKAYSVIRVFRSLTASEVSITTARANISYASHLGIIYPISICFVKLLIVLVGILLICKENATGTPLLPSFCLCRLCM